MVPGAGNLLTEAINKYDNGVIVGVTLFYAVLSVVSIILGDIGQGQGHNRQDIHQFAGGFHVEGPRQAEDRGTDSLKQEDICKRGL